MSKEDKNQPCGCGCDHADGGDAHHACGCGCDHADGGDAHHACGCAHHEKDCIGAPDLHHGRMPHPVTPAFAPKTEEKGVSLGTDVEEEIAAVMKKRYARFLSHDEHFSVKTEVCHQFGLVSAVLSNAERTTHVCAEVSVECESNHIDNPMDAYMQALDALDLVLLDYFDSDRISHYLPIWQSYELDGQNVNVRLEHNNPALDDAASAFLVEHGYLEGGLSPDAYDDDEEADGGEE